MNVVVCTKHVPEPQGTPTLGPDHLLVRSGVEGGLDPGDESGLEAALQLVEREGGDGGDGGQVTAVSMGPEEAAGAVRRALAMGADRGVLVTDPILRGADALVTARVLSALIRRAPFDLVIAGVESTDGSTGTLAAAVAELLDLPSVTFARSIEVAGGVLRADRQTESGYDVLECELPALVTVTAGANEPRFPSLKGIMQAKQKPLDQLTVGDLGLSPEEVQPSQGVVSVEESPPKSGGEVLPGGDEAISRIADLLADAKVI